MKTYHIAFDNDKDMQNAHNEIQQAVRSAGGSLVLCSNGGFHLTKSVLVVDLPDNTDIKRFTDLDAVLVEGDEVPVVPVVTPEPEEAE